ncbi:hypothetical protein [Pseudomarimonas salicorniae]|uniref:DUF1579 domain-containing protein n=1 Tax=Pseudomarimonas salicorniae TaxID=2933270 RepID=A0ABT0GEJ8_9GAMM|nr:hypothetical protein [Lysobacter sp. CAU 1642]MCK7592858.1 hypothetical protein [Lysobacter sp. CAU 1642]
MTLFAAPLVLLALAAEPASVPPPASDCTAAEHRAFDFWLGEWKVQANGQLAGQNRISEEQAGCVLREEWRGAKGLNGTSLNFYDRGDGRWHQLWVDSQGNVLRLAGNAPASGEMRLESDPAAPGPRQRIHWRLREDGVVVQHWEQSTDGGESWTTAFLGEYRKAAEGK